MDATMSRRPDDRIDCPNPSYDSPWGEILYSSNAEYVGGNVAVWDFCHVDLICMAFLEALAEQLGYGGQKKFYRLVGIRFREIVFQTDLLAMTDGYITKNREMNFFLDSLIGTETQIGSSNMVNIVPNVEKMGEENDCGEEFSDSDYDLSDEGEEESDEQEEESDEGEEEIDEAGVEEGDGQGDGQVNTEMNEEGGEGSENSEEEGMTLTVMTLMALGFQARKRAFTGHTGPTTISIL
ncbi:hypothetical protein Salat_2425900 [Sesamum alatum]|uniref:PB1-like domain-containing protein n=1 Tax=Sesamum alatum TaxID=300844 RepID=A0AAE1XY22_9LAMI|nr:hypothetical protein Salat_2425900 [Sesamum alatum]